MSMSEESKKAAQRAYERFRSYAVPAKDLMEPACREWLKRADIVWALDPRPDWKTAHLIYGMEYVYLVASAGFEDRKTYPTRVAAFYVDFREESHDLEYLLAACHVLKGGDCYNGNDETVDPREVRP
jgi:hypothetical protein